MKKYAVYIVIGEAVGLFITFVGIALSALFAKSIFDSDIIAVVACTVKVLSISAGTLFSVFKIGKKGALTGTVIGILYCLCCAALSTLLLKEPFADGILHSLGFDCLIGIISGICGVNLFSK